MRAVRVTIASLTLVGMFVACGGSNAASGLAKPPEFDPKGQSKCSVKQSQSEPLIVEWPSAARGKLESLIESKNVVAVRYSGCEMQVLARCTAPGKYGRRRSGMLDGSRLVSCRGGEDASRGSLAEATLANLA